MGLPISRLADKDTIHDCQIPIRAECTKTVFAVGRPCSLLGHKNTMHIINGDKPCTVPHIGVIANASKTVITEGRPTGRIADAVTCGIVVATGGPNVLVGG